MDSRRENRVLRIAVVILLGLLLADVVRTSGQSQQRLPGPGTGIVDVKVVDDARVVQQGEWRVAQQGEWRVAQQGDWRVGVTGTVATLPVSPPFVAVNRTYNIRWGGSTDWTPIAVREIHHSGWLRVEVPGERDTWWINLAHAAAVTHR